MTNRVPDQMDNIIDIQEYDVPYYVRIAIDLKINVVRKTIIDNVIKERRVLLVMLSGNTSCWAAFGSADCTEVVGALMSAHHAW